MKLALLGMDPSLAELVESIARGGHRLVWAHDLGDAEPHIRSLAPEAEISPNWEALLDGTVADAVLVARGAPDIRADPLRKLVQARAPLLVSHPADPSMLLYYELDMIRRDTGCVMMPYIPSRWHPAVARLESLLADGVCGDIEQIVFERALSDSTPAAVQAQFAIDVDLARRLAGEWTKIGAMAPTPEPAGYANLGIQLSGPRGVMARWSVEPVDDAPGGRLTLLGSLGKATLTMPEGAEPWRLQWRAGESMGEEAFPSGGVPLAALQSLQRSIDGQPSGPTWNDAARSVELADTIDRSLRKGRVVELHYEDHTEHGTFKGTMTSLGCGLMIACIAALPFAALAVRAGLEIAQFIPHLMLAIAIVFLGLQSLMFVFREK